MKYLITGLAAVAMTILPSATTGVTRADTVLFEDFEDTSGLTISAMGPGTSYWGIAPLVGTATYPSSFLAGGSQSGNILYGVKARDNDPVSGNVNPMSATVTLPDLTGYTDLHLTVALAASEIVWDFNHRDRLHIIGSTGPIDSFVPDLTYGGNLESEIHSVDLGYEFRDFTYAIDSSLEFVTFNFASTGDNEFVGIDSLRITGSVVPAPSALVGLIGIAVTGLLLNGRRRRT